jgi:7-cyano-7-deazaguanine synthase
VLLSGGIDSAACLSFYRKLGRQVSALFVDYGQRTRRRERASARAIAAHYRVPFKELSCKGIDVPKGEIPGRNAFLLFAALLSAPRRPGLIAMGIHSGTPYFDCSPGFAKDASSLVQAYSNGTLALGTPFLSWSKVAILSFCTEHGVPLDLTWSCEVGPSKPCGRCSSCRDRKVLIVCPTKHDSSEERL